MDYNNSPYHLKTSSSSIKQFKTITCIPFFLVKFIKFLHYFYNKSNHLSRLHLLDRSLPSIQIKANFFSYLTIISPLPHAITYTCIQDDLKFNIHIIPRRWLVHLHQSRTTTQFTIWRPNCHSKRRQPLQDSIPKRQQSWNGNMTAYVGEYLRWYQQLWNRHSLSCRNKYSLETSLWCIYSSPNIKTILETFPLYHFRNWLTLESFI